MKKDGNPNKDWKALGAESLDKKAVSFKVPQGIRQRLMAVDKWPDKLRAKVLELLKEEEDGP
jgi:hypothetical protein